MGGMFWSSHYLGVYLWFIKLYLFSRLENMDSLSAVNTFALNLFKKLSANDPSNNLFFSPLSVSSALLMASLGARNNTEAQMLKVYQDTIYQKEKRVVGCDLDPTLPSQL